MRIAIGELARGILASVYILVATNPICTDKGLSKLDFVKVGLEWNPVKERAQKEALLTQSLNQVLANLSGLRTWVASGICNDHKVVSSDIPTDLVDKIVATYGSKPPLDIYMLGTIEFEADFSKRDFRIQLVHTEKEIRKSETQEVLSREDAEESYTSILNSTEYAYLDKHLPQGKFFPGSTDDTIGRVVYRAGVDDASKNRMGRSPDPTVFFCTSVTSWDKLDYLVSIFRSTDPDTLKVIDDHVKLWVLRDRNGKVSKLRTELRTSGGKAKYLQVFVFDFKASCNLSKYAFIREDENSVVSEGEEFASAGLQHFRILEYQEDGGYFVPKRYEQRSFKANGKVRSGGREIIITDSRVNKPIDHGVFSLACLRLNEGDRLKDEITGDISIMRDGQWEIVRPDARESPLEISSSRSHIRILVNIAVIVLIVLILAIRKFR